MKQDNYDGNNFQGVFLSRKIKVQKNVCVMFLFV